ncbi:protein CASP [Cucumis melo var. makuwa]|uniref:Protein CASP n=2 Tax=Cucumis melo TaxID=3656 RepID=A0A5A7VMY0_CUCMM|nr:protein CASP [Cucumis melo var. makuwa]
MSTNCSHSSSCGPSAWVPNQGLLSNLVVYPTPDRISHPQKVVDYPLGGRKGSVNPHDIQSMCLVGWHEPPPGRSSFEMSVIVGPKLFKVAAITTTIVPRAQPVPATTFVTPHVLQTLLCLPPLSGVLFFNHVHVQPSPPPSPSAFISQAPICQIYNILKKIEYPPYIGEEDRCEAMFHEDPSWSTSSSMDDLLMFDVRSTIHSSSYEFFQTCLCCSSAVDGGAQPSASSFRLKRRKMAANDDKIFQIPKHFSQHQDMAVRLQCLHPSSAGVAVGWVAENQENSQKNRRKLAESTRDFKKAQPEEKLNLFSSLLKSYQEEVDNLTKRAKFGENAFLNIYQKLYEAPDPYPALASIGEQDLKLSELESENRKMKVELEEFRTEATHLKNQQATIRRLEERNRQLEQQAVGYNSIEAEDWEVATSGEEMSKMESLLLDKNRKMEHELTQFKVKLSEKSSLLDTAESKIAELTEKVVEQQKLIQKLEEDILKGYNSKDQKGSLFDEWDLFEARGELSEWQFGGMIEWQFGGMIELLEL